MQNRGQPAQQQSEVVAGGGEDGVDAVAVAALVAPPLGDVTGVAIETLQPNS